MHYKVFTGNLKLIDDSGMVDMANREKFYKACDSHVYVKNVESLTNLKKALINQHHFPRKMRNNIRKHKRDNLILSAYNHHNKDSKWGIYLTRDVGFYIRGSYSIQESSLIIPTKLITETQFKILISDAWKIALMTIITELYEQRSSFQNVEQIYGESSNTCRQT